MAYFISVCVSVSPLRWLLAAVMRHLSYLRPPDETILDGEGQPYLLRWHLSRKRDSGSWYLHRLIRPDADKAFHDHPWDFTTWVLSGGYCEIQFEYGRRLSSDTLIRGERRFRPANHTHRILAVHPDTWTLVRTERRRQEWGFYDTDGNFTHWMAYSDQHKGRGRS